jgi:hypothetical protein
LVVKYNKERNKNKGEYKNCQTNKWKEIGAKLVQINVGSRACRRVGECHSKQLMRRAIKAEQKWQHTNQSTVLQKTGANEAKSTTHLSLILINRN